MGEHHITIGNIYCNAFNGFTNNQDDGEKYFALPVVAWDVLIEYLETAEDYFPRLIRELLDQGDKTSEELHQLTNLDRELIKHILKNDLRDEVSLGIDRWHLKKCQSSDVPDASKTYVTILQSMLTGNLLPHPVIINDLKTLDLGENSDRPKIRCGTKGRPWIIKPHIIYPDSRSPNAPDLSVNEEMIEEMWERYESRHSEIALSLSEAGSDAYPAPFIHHPRKILGISRKATTDENAVDFLLIKTVNLADSEEFNCMDLLEPTDRLPSDFLTDELKTRMRDDDQIGNVLHLKEIEISPNLLDIIGLKYSNFPEQLVKEVGKFLVLKDRIGNDNEMEDLLLSRLQTMYEGVLREKDVSLKKFSENDYRREDRRRSILDVGLFHKCIDLDIKTKAILYRKGVWDSLNNYKGASLKSLVLRHLLAYCYGDQKTSWFIDQLVNKRMFEKTLGFILEMADIRNSYMHYNADRRSLPYKPEEIFAIVEEQLSVFNEVY